MTGQTQDLMTSYYIPYVLHRPVKLADGSVATGTDGYGREVDGNHAPMFDTLIGLCNPYQTSATVRFHFFNQNGRPLRWSDGSTSGKYVLKAGRSVATTLIPGNVFGPERESPSPPQDFTGYAIIEITPSRDFPVYAMIGGGGFYPKHWNTLSAEIPVYSAITPRSDMIFPYVIPYFEDRNHSGKDSYRTGLVITNFDSVPVNLTFEYVVSDFYKSTHPFSWTSRLQPRRQYVEDIYTALLKAGYPPDFNSEGHLKVHLSTTPLTAPKARVAGYVLLSNRDYDNFSAGQGHWLRNKS